MRKTILLLTAMVIAVTACRKKPDPVQPPQIIDHGGVQVGDGHLNISFENVVGDGPLVLNDTVDIYTNENGDKFMVSNYKYYISNIKLTRDDGSVFVEPESYHLVNHADASSLNFTIHDMPVGSYKSITFMVGVDSARNVDGAQTGALDIANGMFWDWNTGYIMSKLEGQYQAGNVYKVFMYHTGGFSGSYSSLRWITLEFPEKANVLTNTPTVHIKSDVLEWFKTPTTISIASAGNIMEPGKDMRTLVDNYIDMFKVDHVEN